MVHSEKLEETALWKIYQTKVSPNEARSSWVKKVYKAAKEYMADVRQTFQNYTLHDETHILNVLDAMGGLLGNQIEQLTVGEVELLILSASLHDLGMVYTQEEKNQYYQDEVACRKFLKEYCPELLGCPAEDWPEDTRQWYLRTLHPFRLYEILQKEAWKELFDECPLEVVPKRCMIAVCQAHGENPAEFCNKSDLEYLSANDAEPLFCALLLRLGDLLDFDDTRAPRILYSYVVCNGMSRAEWDKHRASAGFRYPVSPSADALPYKARCTNPGVEHAVRDFLNWIDEELGNCIRLQRRCRTGWQQKFPFPREVLKDEIESEGYMSGDFCLTMDQDQILKLLTGENLYDNTDVFIRELLQNSIDATLLRGEMDSDFIPEKARIDLWEWNDKEGNVWFRIDDQGTGMTLGMLQRYFLKVGNSYYNSQELERDLREHGYVEKYNGISRFGIGFLSTFLCGDYAEVSTLYFDSKKNRREEAAVESYQTIRYGLRLQVTGLTGYYTLKNQSEHHRPDEDLPAPESCNINEKNCMERDGYRAAPGTSIAIRLDPGKLGVLNLREVVEKYLCGARVPVYYNNERVGQTYEEMMKAAHEAAGEKLYELTPKMKKQFDDSFPAIRGQYPKIVVTVIPLDTEENRALPDFSGLMVKYDVRFDGMSQWTAKDQTYRVLGEFETRGKMLVVVFTSENTSAVNIYGNDWKELEEKYGLDKVAALEAEFEKYTVCPKVENIAEIWKPFSEHMALYQAWSIYNDHQQEKSVSLSVDEMEGLETEKICLNLRHGAVICVYQGILAGNLSTHIMDSNFAVFLMGRTWKPMVDVSRSKVSGFAPEVLLAISGLLDRYQMLHTASGVWRAIDGWKYSSLEEWRKIQGSQLDQWLRKNQADFFTDNKQMLQEPMKDSEDYRYSILGYNPYGILGHDPYSILFKYAMACFQDQYRMTINYEDGQRISFSEKEDNEIDDTFDLFPPMMFCKAASNQSRQYICSAVATIRRCVTADHPFIIWLLNNAVQLKRYYQRQFQQIVDCLCQSDASVIIEACNSIREQLLSFPERHGVDVQSFPRLTRDDFWLAEEE